MEKGFSSVDILLATVLLGLLVAAMVGSLIFGEQSTQTAGARGRAVLVAEEGLEAARNIRDNSFSNLVNGTYGLAISGGIWTFSGGSDLTDIFTRAITIADSTVSASFKLITSMVTWQQTAARTGTVELKTELTNWRSSGVPATSCVTYCQSLSIYASGVCRATLEVCTAAGGTHEAGGDTFCANPALPICCCQ